MTTYYVHKSGNDSNNGLTLGTAKKTIGAAVSLLGSADTVQVYRGVYKETVAPTTLVWTLKAIGRVIIDGENLRSFGIQANNINQPTMLRVIDGFEIRNCVSAGIYSGANNSLGSWPSTWLTIRNCHIHHCPRGVMGQPGTCSGHTVLDTVIHDCSIAACELDNNGDNSNFQGNLERVTIYGCARGVSRFNSQGGQVNGAYDIKSSLFLNNAVALYSFGGAPNTPSSNYNSFFGNTKVASRNGTDYATLADWFAATGRDANSLSSDPLVIDLAAGLVALQSASPLLGAGFNGEDIGARGVAKFAQSEAFSHTDWGSGIMVDTQVAGGKIELVPPATVGTFTSTVYDLGTGVTRRLTGFDLMADETEPTDVVDADIDDAGPNRKTIEVRMSATVFSQAAGFPAWVKIEQGANVVLPNTLAGRYIQYRLTLRKDGVEA